MGGFGSLHVVVTGGTGALGTAVVQGLVASGAVVHVPCFESGPEEGHPLAHLEGVHFTCSVDGTDEDAVGAFYGSIPKLWASIQIAGGFAMGPLAQTSLADLRAMLDMNTVTCFLACREAVARIRAGGGGGRLVNVGAKPALQPVGGMAAYSASKAAVVNLTCSLAEELAPEGILVNAVIPSVIDTPGNRAAMPDADHESWPSVDDVAAQILALASPENRVTRGSLACVYGRS